MFLPDGVISFHRSLNDSDWGNILAKRIKEKRTPILLCNKSSEFKWQSMDTIGNLIDKLTIVNVRIWMAEDIKRAKDATDKQIADATRITNIANQQRNNLIEEIDKALGINNPQGSTKMYGKTV